MKHILYFLLKEKDSFLSGQYKFLAKEWWVAKFGEGRSYWEKNCIDVFHVSDNLEQFERLLFFYYLDGWGLNENGLVLVKNGYKVNICTGNLFVIP